MELKDLQDLEVSTRKEVYIALQNMQHFCIEEPHNIHLLSLLTESYSLRSKLLLELVAILEEAEGIEEKDGKTAVPLQEKTLMFLQTAIIAKIHVDKDLRAISKISIQEV